jgi:hypothetical protein
MVGLGQLWLPIVLSAVIVFVLSSIIHMMLPWHKGDYRQVPDEDRFMDATRPFNLPPGDYMLPRPNSMADMKSEAFQQKMQRGPKYVITVMPNGMGSMGSRLVQWFIYSLVIGVFAGYVTGHALGAGANYLQVFRYVGATTFLAYGMALWQYSIWYKRSWMTTLKSNVDALIYACFTAGTFGWLWPK